MAFAPLLTPSLEGLNPDPEEAHAIQEFWSSHVEEFRLKYPDRFVAVKDGEVVADEDDLVMLVYRLRDLGLDARADVAIEFISTEPANLLL